MVLSNDINIRIVGKAGRITLTRPETLNAMSHEMCMAIGKALDDWADNDAVRIVIIDAEGSRSFCAGGDIGELYRTGKEGNFDYGRDFWRDEYRINAQIKHYHKPYIAIMDGIVMGGGVGISAHGSHRIVTENTLFAMPECGIGLAPDVGGNQILSRAPGRIGEYLATTGARLKAADCIYAGVADIYMPEADIPELIETLEESADLSFLDTFAKEPEPGKLEVTQSHIDEYFRKDTAVTIAASLEANGGEWELEAAKLMRRNCPLSVACAVEMVRQSREFKSIFEILELEYRFTYRSMSSGDLLEGIRAQIIDKDRKPKWKKPRLEDVSLTEVEQMLAPLPVGNLVFGLPPQTTRSSTA